MNWLRLIPRRFRRRCGALPPEKLPDAGPCTMYRGHEKDTLKSGSDEWFHWSGEPENEYLWNDTRWGWRGPVMDLHDMYSDLISGGNNGWLFTEGSQ